MKKILVKLYSAFLDYIQIYKWKRQSKKVRKTIVKKNLNALEKKGKYLLLIPHADDEWIGAASVVTDSNYNVILCNMNMSGEDTYETHKIRLKELETVAKRYNRRLISGSNNLKNTILMESPDYILLPFFIDWHKEHIAVISELESALRDFDFSCGVKIIMYQVSLPIPTEYITHINQYDLKSWINKWVTFKKMYKSQLKIPYMRFAFNEYINGKIIGSCAAEVFVEMPIREWLEQLKSFLLEDDEILLLKNNLNDLINVRKYIEKVKKIGNNRKNNSENYS